MSRAKGLRMRWHLFLLAVMGLAGCRQPAPPLQVPERHVSVNQASAARVYDRWSQALASSEASASLLATEEEITSLAAANLAGTPVEDITVWVNPQGLSISASLRLRRLHTATALVRIEARDGVPYGLISDAAFDGHRIPRLIRLSIQQAINDALTDANLPIIVDRLVLGEGYLQLTTRPK